eukprot:TRINITY_DN17924_c4_g1_i1.p2 TRINITY_DN17924_c4_g1~~TRINITY_DN17924_c4_g1_i1.p2  ORF type:complete len:214 (+),score=52.98 TRINITY_DN17924_c4_g1_i1:35-643(+)
MRRVLIAGHLDTVHPDGGPFQELTVAEDGATAVGPGCVDMKGGLVIAACALESLEEAGVPASWTYLLNADEETGSYHSEAALRDQASQHDFGLALEPALPGGELAIERMGSGQFMIEAERKKEKRKGEKRKRKKIEKNKIKSKEEGEKKRKKEKRKKKKKRKKKEEKEKKKKRRKRKEEKKKKKKRRKKEEKEKKKKKTGRK